MAAAVWAAAAGLDPWLTARSVQGIAALAVVIAVGLAVYGGAATLLGAARPAELKSALRRRG